MNCPLLFLVVVARDSTKSLCLLAAPKYHLKENSLTAAFVLFVPMPQLDLLGRFTPAYPGTEFALPCFKWE